MSKTKHNPSKKKESNFIRFSKVQQGYLNEIRVRQVKEFNEALQIVYEELGIVEEMERAKNKIYKLKLDDLSGIDIFPADPLTKKD